jgi:hypothetical protein
MGKDKSTTIFASITKRRAAGEQERKQDYPEYQTKWSK